jgi:hypothetical protein
MMTEKREASRASNLRVLRKETDRKEDEVAKVKVPVSRRRFS